MQKKFYSIEKNPFSYEEFWSLIDSVREKNLAYLDEKFLKEGKILVYMADRTGVYFQLPKLLWPR